MKILNSLLLCLMGFPVFAQQWDFDNLAGEVLNDGSVELTWTVQQLTPGSPFNFIYEFEQATEGTFNPEHHNYDRFIRDMYDPSEINDTRTSTTRGGLAPHGWYFRMRILHKPGNEEDAITVWSDPILVVVPEGLGTPTLTLHTLSSVVKGEELTLSVGTDSGNDVDLYYGTNPNVVDFWDYHERGISPILHTVDLTKFSPGDRLYFVVRVYTDIAPAGVYSLVQTVVWDPDHTFFYVIPHVTNRFDSVFSWTKTDLYISSASDAPVLVEFSARVGNGGVFGEPGPPQVTRHWFGAGSKLNVTTNDIFGAQLHQRPILIRSEQPLNISTVFQTQFGSSISVGSVPAANQTSRAWKVHGIWGDQTVRPGLVVSNPTARDGVAVIRVLSVSNQVLDPAQTDSNIATLVVPAYESSVLMLDSRLNLLPNFAGTLEITTDFDSVALGVTASFHPDFSTLHYITAEAQ